MGEALELCGVVKSTGPDLDKILHTLEFFGPKPGYVMCGYPPFMKRVLDGMRERRFRSPTTRCTHSSAARA